MYNALAGTNYGPDTEIEITTLSDVVFLNQLNDLSFTIDGRTLVLIEHQSTLFPNMPVRMLMYLGRLYEKILNDENLFSSKAKKIPAPEFFVLYNGKADLPSKREYRLSDLLMKQTNSVELVVKVFDVRYDEVSELFKQSETLKGYAYMVKQVHHYVSLGQELSKAMENAIVDSMASGYIVDYLRNHGTEVVSMISKNFSMEDYGNLVKKETITDVIFNMFKKSTPVEDIVDYTGFSSDEIEEIKKKWEAGVVE